MRLLAGIKRQKRESRGKAKRCVLCSHHTRYPGHEMIPCFRGCSFPGRQQDVARRERKINQELFPSTQPYWDERKYLGLTGEVIAGRGPPQFGGAQHLRWKT